MGYVLKNTKFIQEDLFTNELLTANELWIPISINSAILNHMHD